MDLVNGEGGLSYMVMRMEVRLEEGFIIMRVLSCWLESFFLGIVKDV